MINKLKEFIYLGRFNSPTGALLLAYPCFWGIALSNPILLDLFLYIKKVKIILHLCFTKLTVNEMGSGVSRVIQVEGGWRIPSTAKVAG